MEKKRINKDTVESMYGKEVGFISFFPFTR